MKQSSQNQTHALDLLETWKSHFSQAEHALTTRIIELDTKLLDLQQNTASDYKDDLRLMLELMCKQVGCEVKLLSQRQSVIHSLRFECMEARKDAIWDAHERTFDWMFVPIESQGKPLWLTSAFAPWLQTGKGIYWVTGKPGNTDADLHP